MDASGETGRLPPPKRHLWKWLVAPAAIVLATSVLAWAAWSASVSRLDRWYPGRSGDVLVLEKTKRGAPGAEEFSLRVRLDVPPASPADAARIPANVEGREALIGPRTFALEVPVERAKWDAVEPGVRLRAMYQLNVRRTEAFVRTLYLDALGTSKARS